MATLLCTPSGQHTGPEATPGFWRGTVSLEAEAACAWHCPWPPASVAFLPKGPVEAPTLAYGDLRPLLGQPVALPAPVSGRAWGSGEVGAGSFLQCRVCLQPGRTLSS